MIDRLAPTRRPFGPPAGNHCWRTLLFVHWEVPIEALEPLIPSRLSIDTFEGKAYVGLVPFTMNEIHPRWFPPMPGVSAFHETNVRTYVHLDGEGPGVWFFSLDAANPLAVVAARLGWSLRYFFAEMAIHESGHEIRYRSTRHLAGATPAVVDVAAKLGPDLGNAAPGTLAHFLCERYLLYAQRGRRLLCGQVHHTPYPLRAAKLTRVEQTLITKAGIATRGPPSSVLFSPGVDVEVFPLHDV